MTDLRNQRRMASKVLGIGETRVWIDPLHADDVATAVTRADVRKLVHKGYIQKLQEKGVSRGRARYQALQKRSGRQRGPGSRKGAWGAKARNPRKRLWVQTIRPLRRTLKELRTSGKISAADYRLHYMKAKGGVYRSKNHLLTHLKSENVLQEGK